MKRQYKPPSLKEDENTLCLQILKYCDTLLGVPPRLGQVKGPEACQDHGKSVIFLLPSTPG